MTIATAWAATVKFLADNPVIRFLVWLALAIIGWNLLKAHLKEAGRDAERKAIAVKQAQVKVAVNERATEIIEEERTHADAALEARDSDYPATSFDELPDAEKRILDRRFRGGEAS